jgi:acyl dehydratase
VSVAELRPGLELGPSSWIEVPQARIDTFAEAIDDRGSIHVDDELAASGPYGTTVAHGFLTLSLLPALWFEVADAADARVTINYGVDRVRFPAAVPVGSRIRASFRVEEVAPLESGEHVRALAVVEREGHEKPVCVAELVFRVVA